MIHKSIEEEIRAEVQYRQYKRHAEAAQAFGDAIAEVMENRDRTNAVRWHAKLAEEAAGPNADKQRTDAIDAINGLYETNSETDDADTELEIARASAAATNAIN